MADLTAFSNRTFETTNWINNTLRDRPEEEHLESYLASIAMKLHIISQDYTDQLETGMVESMTIMPRVLSDVSRIEEVLKNLETEMQSLASQLKSFDLRNVAGVEDLSRLDTLKSNMEKCKATLEEHARWSQVVREAKNILESGGRLADSADRIETMHRSLQILQNLPGHEERQQTCESLSEALLAALRPRVRRDIVSLDLSPLHEYLYVYEKLSRKHELEEEYVRARPERLKGVWEKYNPDSSTAQFAPWLAVFLGKVASLLSEESSHAESLFGRDRSPDVLCMLLQHSLQPLVDPLSQKLHVADTSSVLCAELYHVTDDFARRVVPFLDGCHASSIYTALSIVFGGFLNYMDAFGEKENAFLKTSLLDTLNVISFDTVLGSSSAGNGGEDEDFLGINENSSSSEGKVASGTGVKGGATNQDPLEVYEAFGDRLVAAADMSYEPTHAAVLRAVSIMGGLKAKAALRAAATALASFTKALTMKVDNLRVAAGFPSTEGLGSTTTVWNDDTSSGSGLTSGSSSSSSMANAASQLAESWARRLEENDVRGRELVPGALRALQASGRLCRKVRELDVVAAEALSDLSGNLFKDISLDRAVALITSHQQLQQATSNATTPTVGIASMNIGTIFANCLLQSDLSAASELRSFLNASASHHASQTVFASVNAALSRLKLQAGTLLFDLCTVAPEKMVADLHAEDVWTQQTGGGDGMDLLPLHVITQVGEHLLSLVQELETFASSDALPDLLCLTGDTNNLDLAVRRWRSLKVIMDARHDSDEGWDQLCRRASCANAVVTAEKSLFGVQLSRVMEDLPTSTTAAATEQIVGELTGDETVDQDAEAAALGFVNEWLGAIADSTVGLIVAQWLQVSSLSPAGRSQLVVDLEYLSNVVQAIGLRQHPLLVHMRQLLLKDPQSLLVAMEAAPARTPVSGALHKVESKLVKALAAGHGLR